MEEALIQAFVESAQKFPKLLGGYLALSGLYQAFCFISTMTKTTKDDKIVDRLKVFFSIPLKKTSD